VERWFAVCCKPRQEVVAQENLLRQGFHVYLPRVQVRRLRGGKWVDAIEVLFPRYLFIRIDSLAHSMAPVRSTRGVVGLVRFGQEPAVVPDRVIEALLQREDGQSGLHCDNCPPLCSGQPVKFIEGPLVGIEGIYNRQDGDERVIVLLELLGKTNKIITKREWVATAM
jgi:transcriptional antiterminator RfaH